MSCLQTRTAYVYDMDSSQPLEIKNNWGQNNVSFPSSDFGMPTLKQSSA